VSITAGGVGHTMADWAKLGIPELLLHSCGLPSFGIRLSEGMVKRHSLLLSITHGCVRTSTSSASGSGFVTEKNLGS